MKTLCSSDTPNCWNKQCLPELDYSVFQASLTFTADIFNIWKFSRNEKTQQQAQNPIWEIVFEI